METFDPHEADLGALTRQVWDEIQRCNERNPQLFRYGGRIVRVVASDDDSAVVEEVTKDRMKWFLAERFSWKDANGNTDKPSTDLVSNLLATPDPALPRLERIISAPCFARDGTLHDQPGYNEASLCYLAPSAANLTDLGIERPDENLIEWAREQITNELFGDFPFASPADRAHAVALLLLPFVRSLIDGPTPLHGIFKPVEGSGGTLLGSVALAPAIGGSPAIMTAEGSPQELRYTLSSQLSTAPVVVFIDNVDQKLTSPVLCSAITSKVWGDRQIGASRIVRVPVRCVWVATGNNPALSREIARRTVLIRLDPPSERPWENRVFRHPRLMSWAIENRPELVLAALILIQAWIDVGRPAGSKILGSFEEWSEVLGGILEVAGIEGFLDNQGELFDSPDDELREIKMLFALWFERCRSEPMTVAQIFEVVAESEQHLEIDSSRARLGRRFRELRDRRFDIEISGSPFTVRLTSDGKLHNAVRWRLDEVDQRRGEDGRVG